MPTPSTELTQPSQLRRIAETRLKEGTAPAGSPLGANALSQLWLLASNPASATEALKLLHELQVHQVELDLQLEQIETTKRERMEDVARYEELYEHAPVAYLSLSSQHDILECNIAAAGLFGVTQDELRGRSIDKSLLPASRPTLQQLLKRLRPDGARESCAVQIQTTKGPCKMRVLASVTPGGRSFLVILVDFLERS